MPDPILAELHAKWDQEDQLRPDAPAGPRHGETLIDLTTRTPEVQWIFWRGLTDSLRLRQNPSSSSS